MPAPPPEAAPTEEDTVARHSTTLLAAVALALATAPLPRTAAACSCTNELTLQQEFGFANAVFSGRVVSVDPVGDGFHVLAVLEPIARWKGGIGPTVGVLTPENQGICGFPFEIGGEYLVFAFESYAVGSTPFFTHSCSRTSPLADNPYVPLLGPPLLPTGASPTTWGAIKLLYH
jgi:hypothetical protein